jgi:hypothetical protein
MLILLLTTVLNALAYSPGTHRLILQAAARDYNTCVAQLGLDSPPLSPTRLAKLKKGSTHEDLNPFVKFTQWHFYHPTKELGAGALGFGHGSFEHRYGVVEGRLAKKFYRSLGAMAHYVQDVTNPAHVAPIYHGIGDGFDYFNFKANWPAEIEVRRCEELYQRARAFRAANPGSTFSLVRRVTGETLLKMQEKIAVMSPTHQGFYTWEEAFWTTTYGPGSIRKSFGHYGFLGNGFGKRDVGVAPEVMSDFARGQIRTAIDATVELFLMQL